MIFGESSQIKLHLQFMLYSTKFQAGSKVKCKNLNFQKKKIRKEVESKEEEEEEKEIEEKEKKINSRPQIKKF